MPTQEQIHAGHLGRRNSVVKTVLPPPDVLAEREPDVELLRTESGVQFVRTPASCFGALEDYPWKPRYAEIDGLRMAYIDEGPKDAECLLLVHGQPTWGYIYRRMIPILLEAGYRVIVPDLIGFGRSDKPIDQRYHAFDKHADNLTDFIKALNLTGVSLLCQDWGSVVSLVVAAEQSERFSRILLTNGALLAWVVNPFYIPEPVELDPDISGILEFFGETSAFSAPFPVFFQSWINYTLTAERWKPEEMIALSAMAGGRPLTDEEISAFAAPFPSLIYRAAPRTFPSMICQLGARNLRAWEELSRFTKPFLIVRGALDNQFGTKELQQIHIDLIPGASGQPHSTLQAGHFTQDNKGEELAEIFCQFIADTQT